jgi:hypothetical protein
MPKWSRDYLLTSILSGIAAVLGLALAVEWTVLARHRSENLQPPPAKTAPAQESDAEDEADFELPALDEYEQMTERPLFMESRRPGAVATETAAPPPPPTPMNLKLMGIVWTPEGRTALMADAKGKYKRLKAQDTLDGWTLIDLGTDKVTMQQGEKREDLPLLKKRPKTSTPPNAPPPPGQPPMPGQPAPGQPVPGQPVPGQRPQPQPVQPEPVDIDEENQDIPEEEMEPDTSSEDTDIAIDE